MSKIAIEGNASGTGTFTIASPNSNSSRTLSLPDGTGTFVVNGINSSIVSGTSVASTSGTSIDFTGIPSWVKRITVMFAGVSTNGTSIVQIQLGTSGGATTSGYVGVVDSIGSGGASPASLTSGLGLFRSGAASTSNVIGGIAIFTNVTSNNWVGCFNGCLTTGVINTTVGSTQISLSGTLDRVRITTVNGTDTFDAGSINILYE
jgi:hypothetical protein